MGENGFGLRTFRFTNDLQERIKFVNRGLTVHIYIYIYICVCVCVYIYIHIYIYISQHKASYPKFLNTVHFNSHIYFGSILLS